MRIKGQYREHFKSMLWEGDIIKIKGTLMPLVSYYGEILAIKSSPADISIRERLLVNIFCRYEGGVFMEIGGIPMTISATTAIQLSDEEFLQIQNFIPT
jgi:hypothetical protein